MTHSAAPHAMGDAEPATPPALVALPACVFAFRSTRSDARCALCAQPIGLGDTIVKLDSDALSCAPLQPLLRGYPQKGWSHECCFATARAWRTRAGLERAPASWSAADASAEERRAAALLGQRNWVARSAALCVGGEHWSPSPQQVALYRWVLERTGNVVLHAAAGSGKSATLRAALTLTGFQTPNARLGFGFMVHAPLVLAFNRHNMADLHALVPKDAAEVRTFHSLGAGVWNMQADKRDHLPRSRIVAKKTALLLRALLPDVRVAAGGAARPDVRFVLLKPFVKLAVSLAKCWALGLPGGEAEDTDEGWARLLAHFHGRLGWLLRRAHDSAANAGVDGAARRYTVAQLQEMGLQYARSVFADSLRAAYQRGEFDFDDQLFAPLAYDRDHPEAPLEWHRRAWVLVDEAQDVNAARRLLLQRVLDPDGGRLLAVGDHAQALYGFTGADSAGMAALASAFAAEQLSLPTCYRCPTLHVAAAAYLLHEAQSGIAAHPGAPSGSIALDAQLYDHSDTILGGAAVLCRANAPLLQLYKALLRRGLPARLVGACSVGGKLRKVLASVVSKRLAAARAAVTPAQLRAALEAHAQAKRGARPPGAASAGAGAGDGDDDDDLVLCLLALLRDVEAQSPLSGAALLSALHQAVDATYPGTKARKPWEDDPAAGASADDPPLSDGEADDAATPCSTGSRGAFVPRRGELVLCTVHKAKGREWDVVYLLQPQSLHGAHAAVQHALRGGDAARLAVSDASDWEERAERNVTYVALTRSRGQLLLLRDAGERWSFNAAALLPPEQPMPATASPLKRARDAAAAAAAMETSPASPVPSRADDEQQDAPQAQAQEERTSARRRLELGEQADL